MISRDEMAKLAKGYKGLTVGVVGSHSALDVCEGAKAEGFQTLVVCEKGREKVYSHYYKTRTRGSKTLGIVDETLVLPRFRDMANAANVKKLQEKSTILVPHRSFSVYVGYDAIENDFAVPIFGNRALLRAEERNAARNQYYLLKKAGVRTPRTFSTPDKIDCLTLVKASEARRSYERAFFFAASSDEYEERSRELIKKGIITEAGLKAAPIEEFVLGAQYNFNFFVSPLSGELELSGIDMRRQTNLDGVLRLPAAQQIEVEKHARINNIEIGHVACTIKESMLEKVFAEGEKFAESCRKEYAPGIIGPFALQGAVVPEEKGEEIVIFDVSFRMPGSPGTRFTPYSGYLFRENISVGRRVAQEIAKAKKEKRIGEVIT